MIARDGENRKRAGAVGIASVLGIELGVPKGGDRPGIAFGLIDQIAQVIQERGSDSGSHRIGNLRRHATGDSQTGPGSRGVAGAAGHVECHRA